MPTFIESSEKQTGHQLMNLDRVLSIEETVSYDKKLVLRFYVTDREFFSWYYMDMMKYKQDLDFIRSFMAKRP
jgi:hypothetical protein